VTTLFGVPLPAILGQLMLGLVNGSFYALLSLGLAVIFGLLGIVNFAHGAFYMLGAFAAYIGLQTFGVNYWFALLLSPLLVGLLGILIERLFLRHLYRLDPLYGLLLTFGIALIAEGIIRENRVVLRLTPYATFETPPRHVYSADDVNENLTHELGTSLPW